MDDPDEYADRDLPPPRIVPPFSTVLLFAALVGVLWCCGLVGWLLSRLGPIGPDN